jgi:hypothetical protein
MLCSSSLRTQWVQPSNVLVVVMIIGGDAVQGALAQLSGGFFTPVAFSFGWVAYSFSSLVRWVGIQKLMPEADYPSIIINGRSGYARQNKSWVLGRVLRDFNYWKPQEVEDTMARVFLDAEKAAQEKAAPSKDGFPFITNSTPAASLTNLKRVGLCVSIFDTAPQLRSGTPINDWVFYSGILTTIVQLVIAIIPCILRKNWSILTVTAGGMLICFSTGALPIWNAEKWGCRRRAKTTILTEGNGAQHAIVIVGQEGDLDLEALAVAAGENRKSMLFFTTVFMIAMLFLWLALLITVSGVVDNGWFLLGVGGIGMLQNICVAGAPRKPRSFGLHLMLKEVIADRKVMKALMEVEEKYPHVGASLLPTFFPGKLRPEEVSFWELKAKQANEKEKLDKKS